MSTVKELRSIIKDYKKVNCPPYSNRKKQILIKEAKKLGLRYSNRTVKQLKKEIKDYKQLHCYKTPRRKKELEKDFRIKLKKKSKNKKKVDNIMFKKIDEQIQQEKKNREFTQKEYDELIKLKNIKKNKKIPKEKSLEDLKHEKDLLQDNLDDLEVEYMEAEDEDNEERMNELDEEIRNLEEEIRFIKFDIEDFKKNKKKTKNIKENIFSYNEIEKLVTLLPNYLIPVGSYIRKKENPSDLDIVTTENLNNVFEWFNNNFKIIETLARGEKHLDIRIQFNEKILGINVWKGTQEQLIYLEFAYSYPQTLTIALRKKAKSKGLSLSQYGFFNKAGFLIPVNNFQDIFDVLDVEYRTPEEEELRETKYKHIKDGKEALNLIRGNGLLINGYFYNGGTLDDVIKDEINRQLYFKRDVIYGPVEGGIDLLYPLKKGYELLANKYRKKFCNGRARPLKLGEIHPLCANFEGPGTRIDLEQVRDYPSFNAVDACAKQHDIAYLNASKIKDNKLREQAIRKADEIIIECLKEVKGDEPYKSLGLVGIEGKMKIENLIPKLAKLISGKEYFGHK